MHRHFLFSAVLLFGSLEHLAAMPLCPGTAKALSSAIILVQAYSAQPTGGTVRTVPGNGGPLGTGLNGVTNGTQVGVGAPSSLNPAGANGSVNTAGQGALRPNAAGATQPNGSKPSHMMPNGVQKID